VATHELFVVFRLQSEEVGGSPAQCAVVNDRARCPGIVQAAGREQRGSSADIALTLTLPCRTAGARAAI
jgi:hypothetical protein